MARWILHVDMDEFFAAVERLDNPALAGKAILVGASARERGVVATASYEARKFGCHSAMPTGEALRLCPHAVLVPPRHGRYEEVGLQVREILERFSPAIEPLGLDEAFLDVTGSGRLFGPAPDIAANIKATIRRELKLTASVGVAPNKFLAKLASDLRKPDALMVITPETVQATLDPLPVRKIWGVGPAAEAQLAAMGIRTIAQLRVAGEATMERRFGQSGLHLLQLARGEDARPVVMDERAKSISQEVTFATDLADLRELRAVLLRQTEQVARRLRRSGLRAKTVSLKLRSGDFVTRTRSHTLEEPTDVTDELWSVTGMLFDRWWAAEACPLRLIGMGVSQLTAGGQLTLLPPPHREKRQRLDKALDALADRFGPTAPRRGGSPRQDREGD
ncbi:MAG: DNA polymerase IV [Planctomycetota bacterium]|nr:DNA polymerase IV [Planctomycetota bacterium]